METSGYSTDHRRSVEPLERAPVFAYLDPTSDSTATSVCMKRSTSADRLTDPNQWRRRTRSSKSPCSPMCCCPSAAAAAATEHHHHHHQMSPKSPRSYFCNPLVVCPFLFALVLLSLFGAVVWRLGSLEARVADLEAQLTAAALSPTSAHTADYNRRVSRVVSGVNVCRWLSTPQPPPRTRAFFLFGRAVQLAGRIDASKRAEKQLLAFWTVIKRLRGAGVKRRSA